MPDLISTGEAAKILRCTPGMIFKYADKGHFAAAMRAGGGKKRAGVVMWKRSDIEAFREKRAEKRRGRANRRRLSAEYLFKDGAKHGTRTAYVKGCRCDDCREANNEYFRVRRIK